MKWNVRKETRMPTQKGGKSSPAPRIGRRWLPPIPPSTYAISTEAGARDPVPVTRRDQKPPAEETYDSVQFHAPICVQILGGLNRSTHYRSVEGTGDGGCASEADGALLLTAVVLGPASLDAIGDTARVRGSHHFRLCPHPRHRRVRYRALVRDPFSR